MSQSYYIGVDIGGTKVAYGLFDEGRKLVARHRHQSDASLDASEFCGEIVLQALALLDREGISRRSLKGVGVAVPSFVIFDEGVIFKTINIPKLRDFAARECFSKAFGVPVALDNDANAAALAEHRRGAGVGHKHMIYCPVSTGISSGIIINGELFRGSYGFAGETGHMIANVEGDITALCQCGNPECFESHVSGSKITERVAQRIRAGEDSVITGLCAGDLSSISAEHIKEACDLGDELGLWALSHMSRYLGVWLYNLYQAFGINCYVLGGGLMNFGDMLLGAAREVFDTCDKSGMPVYFKKAKLGDDFGIVGAVELLFDSGR